MNNEEINNNEINKENVDNSGKELRMGKLKDEMIPKTSEVQNIGKFLKDQYYPGLSLDEINERIDALGDKGISVNEVVNKIKTGELNLATISVEEIKNLNVNNKENEGQSLND